MSSDEDVRLSTGDPSEPYEEPKLIDYGSLAALTLSGTSPLSEGFGAGAAGGGS